MFIFRYRWWGSKFIIWPSGLDPPKSRIALLRQSLSVRHVASPMVPFSRQGGLAYSLPSAVGARSGGLFLFSPFSFFLFLFFWGGAMWTALENGPKLRVLDLHPPKAFRPSFIKRSIWRRDVISPVIGAIIPFLSRRKRKYLQIGILDWQLSFWRINPKLVPWWGVAKPSRSDLIIFCKPDLALIDIAYYNNQFRIMNANR